MLNRGLAVFQAVACSSLVIPAYDFSGPGLLRVGAVFGLVLVFIMRVAVYPLGTGLASAIMSVSAIMSAGIRCAIASRFASGVAGILNRGARAVSVFDRLDGRRLGRAKRWRLFHPALLAVVQTRLPWKQPISS